ncbi:hypothetical protein BZL70_24280 [Escherichia coli]|nr:hypothetical protein BZL70_24280 [Escherichia coli]
MSRVTAIISALVICIIVCLSWAVNHYRDNAIAYKEQRDKATSIIADMQKRQRDVAELDARYTKEELNYYRLRSGIDRITAQVNYLQEYIRTQCLR